MDLETTNTLIFEVLNDYHYCEENLLNMMCSWPYGDKVEFW